VATLTYIRAKSKSKNVNIAQTVMMKMMILTLQNNFLLTQRLWCPTFYFLDLVCLTSLLLYPIKRLNKIFDDDIIMQSE